VDEDQIERPEAAVLYLAASSQTGECSRERLLRPIVLVGVHHPRTTRRQRCLLSRNGVGHLFRPLPVFFSAKIILFRIYCSWYRTSPVSRYPSFAGVKETIHEMGDSKLGSSL